MILLYLQRLSGQVDGIQQVQDDSVLSETTNQEYLSFLFMPVKIQRFVDVTTRS